MASTYPVRLEGRPDAELSQWLWLVKWFLVIPHLVVLAFLWTAFWVLTVFAFFAILITGRYPRSVFDFNVGVMRWSWRVAFYAYGALGTDRYPPFSLGEEPDYPATLHVDYPERLSRGLVLVKSWLLAIPHYVVIGFFLGGAGYVGWRWGETVLLGGSGLITVLVLIGAVILLFTGKFPCGVQDFVLGMDRWVVRVGAYATLMTDKYPPFRLDAGPNAAEQTTVDESAAPPARPVGSAGRVTVVVLGVLATLVGLGLAGGGGVLVWADQTQKDLAGYIQTGTQHFSTGTQVLRFEDVDLRGIPYWMLGDVRVRVRSDRPVFVGIGHSGDVARYLAGVRYDQISMMTPRMYRQEWMSQQIAPPEQQPFWYAATSGSGQQQLDWDVQRGQWAVVVLNSDTSAGLDVDMSFGATVPGLYAVGIMLLGTGVIAITVGVLLQYVGLRRRAEA
ncbi:DUF4389 domain-containing protein [Kibdelosporangium aridum]|uniref:DUF4389 domain-containing protein n=1 Tax=Kibdelosporangium aridum TaxID=2030 RepID=A0A428ZAU6_KIBAR|nr:DUF4389 domain-containing protein [Kibdelosporangium aridum]RSM85184.1 DUF4389 domain-containing protein [Kibdelosporangium aridum]